MPKRKKYLDELTTTSGDEAFDVVPDDSGITSVEVTLDPEPAPEVARSVQLSPYEGCVIWGSWRGIGPGWWEVAGGKLIRVPDAHQLHPSKKRLDHLPGNLIPDEMELA
jgi:hypothetical protein